VSQKTLRKHGAVSEETAREMAAGALARSRGTLSLAVTGIAGPGGGSAGRPVGMVCFAWAGRRGPPRSETRRFRGGREAVRRQSVVRALEGVLELLEGA
jgi:nicotinamide-nucleotide amidase